MKKVGITQRVDHWQDRDETRDAIDQRLIKWILECDCLPVLIPNVFQSSVALYQWLGELGVDALLFSGGGNIGQWPQRDEQERWLLDWAQALQIPVLGICRGMQVMATFHGASLQRVSGHVAKRHTIKGELNLVTNSFHDYAVLQVPTGWKLLAQSEDKVIEAIMHTTLPWEAWMFHPERDITFNPELKVRFTKLMGIKE